MFEIGIESDGDRGRPVESIAQVLSTALDKGLSFPFSRLACHGRQAGKRGGLLFAECADLGAFDEDRGGNHAAYSTDRLQDGIGSCVFWRRFQPACDLTLKRIGPVFDLGRARPRVTPGYGQCPRLQPVLQPRAVLDECRAGDLQLLEFILSLIGRLAGNRIERRAHPRQHARIHPVGLGPPSARLREAACPRRVDLDQRQLAGEGLLEAAMVGTGCFINRQMRLPVTDPALQRPEPGRVVGVAGKSTRAEPVNVQG